MTPELKELLQLAAKAAGYSSSYLGVYDEIHVWAPMLAAPWRPHEDVNDALRLALDAKLVTDFYGRDVWHYDDDTSVDSYPISWNKGDDVGMCMAIICAAAEKGKAM